MESRALGRTGLEVSAVGFGAWGVAGEMWRGASREDGHRALHAALDAGVTFIDTALIYGRGESERLVGEVLRERGDRGQVVVATKIPPADERWPPDRHAALASIFPPDHVERSVDSSLRNLGQDALDLDQLHVWLDAWLDDPAWPALRATLDRLQRAGKVRHWGVSANDHAPGDALRVLDEPVIETVQVIHNLFDRSAEPELLPRAAARGAGVIARCPFDEGALTGAVRADSTFAPGDFRARYFRGDRAAAAAARADALRPLLGAEAATLAELALRFVLSREEISVVIPGMRRATHATANAAIADGRALSPALLERLAPHAWSKNWYN
jgi:aryl-alcohol dehydrogenase-like predicted oxidoreductase